MSINHCPDNLKKENVQAISAPYNFVPLSSWVHIPRWQAQVSHDWPLQDGLSGEIGYQLIADSPLLVGGHQAPATDREPGEVKPFQLPDGRYAIPGSSLKGMLRAVVEIAGFGRMRMVDDQRPALRDITGPKVSASYTHKVRDKVKTGFLHRRDDGGQEIVPCSMVRLDHRKLEEVLRVHKPIFKARINVKEKYQVWQRHCQKNSWDPLTIRFDLGDHEAVNLGAGEKSGTPVFTGQISDSTKPKGKYKDFVFYDANENHLIRVKQDEWRDFLHIHGDDSGKDEMSWPGYWREQFRNGESVPVFYLQDGDLLRIGLAYMPKLAGDFSIHDTIAHASEAHLQAPGLEHGYDLADLLFGAIGEQQQDALRGRVSCETAIAQGEPQPVQQDGTILNGPKPTYFPNYISQSVDRNNVNKLSGGQYATYMEISSQKPPLARGFKRYPARPEKMTEVQQLTSGQISNKKVQVFLHPLPTGTQFSGRILFHNLKPEELGALLWAMSWNGDNTLRHGLGMGKSFGFGQVRFELDEYDSRIMPNDPEQSESKLDMKQLNQWLQRFTRHMEQAAMVAGDQSWMESPQIANLLAMADPESAKRLPPGMQLRHMCLAMQSKNEFAWAKQNSLVLADYAQATRWHAHWLEKKREQETERQALAAEAREREQKEARERKRAEFAAKPKHEQEIIKLKQQLASFPQTGPLGKDRYSEFLGVLKPFEEKAKEYLDEQARTAMADALEKHYERLGWAPSGLKKARRDKQVQKRRASLDALRNGE